MAGDYIKCLVEPEEFVAGMHYPACHLTKYGGPLEDTVNLEAFYSLKRDKVGVSFMSGHCQHLCSSTAVVFSVCF